jgi:hypothetical protein
VLYYKSLQVPVVPKVAIGRNAHAYVHDVGEKYGYKIKELNFQKEMQPVSKRLHLSLKVIILWILKRKNRYIA